MNHVSQGSYSLKLFSQTSLSWLFSAKWNKCITNMCRHMTMMRESKDREMFPGLSVLTLSFRNTWVTQNLKYNRQHPCLYSLLLQLTDFLHILQPPLPWTHIWWAQLQFVLQVKEQVPITQGHLGTTALLFGDKFQQLQMLAAACTFQRWKQVVRQPCSSTDTIL